MVMNPPSSPERLTESPVPKMLFWAMVAIPMTPKSVLYPPPIEKVPVGFSFTLTFRSTRLSPTCWGTIWTFLKKFRLLRFR